MRVAALALVLVLAGCRGTASDATTGPPLARYELRSLEGEQVGDVALHEGDGGGLIELVSVAPERPGEGIEGASWLSLAVGACEFHRTLKSGRRGTQIDLERDGDVLRWSYRHGLEIARRTLTSGSEACHLSGGNPVASAWTLSVAPWQRALATLGPSFEPGDRWEGRSVNMLEGREETLVIEARGWGELSREGEALAALSMFAHVASQGWTLWADRQGEILAVEDAMHGLTLVREGVALPDVPSPVVPSSLVEEGLELERPDVMLSGILTRPRGTVGALPLVVLIHGSGPVDRDGNALGLRHHPFRLLAYDLARRGFAVMRYDKRGVAGSTALRDEIEGDVEALEGDVLAWIEQLTRRVDIDEERVYLVGHSEGGILAPRVATRDRRVAGLVMLAGPAQRLDRVLREQGELMLRAHGLTEDEIAAMGRQQDAVLRVVAAGKDRDLPVSAFGERTGDWLRSHMECDPESIIRALEVPVLALYGGDDLQVPPSEAVLLDGWLEDRRHPSTSVEILEGMDHLLMPTTEPLGMGAYGDPDRGLDPRVLSRVGGWLVARSREGEVLR